MYIYVHGNVEINALHRIFKNTTATNNHCLFTTFTENDADDDPPIPSLSAAAAAAGGAVHARAARGGLRATMTRA